MKDNEHNDYSVCTVWLDRGYFYLLNVYREKLDYPNLKRAVIQWADIYPDHAGIIIEDNGLGTALIQELPEVDGVRPIAFKPEGSKEMRAHAQTARIEAGYVVIPESAPWLGDFLTEVRQFPAGRHDDQVDSMIQFLTYIHRKPAHTFCWA